MTATKGMKRKTVKSGVCPAWHGIGEWNGTPYVTSCGKKSHRKLATKRLAAYVTRSATSTPDVTGADV